MKRMKPRTVYFNSSCPVCNAGVTRQRKIMDVHATCPVEWRDINDDAEALAAHGVTIDDVRRKLYVEDDQGNLHVGAAAFAALWRATPGQRLWGRLASAPPLSTVARWAYDAFAAALFRWNRYKGRW